MRDDLRPILIGGGQVIQRDVEPSEALSPVGLLAASARAAADDSGAGEALLQRVDTVGVVDVMGWRVWNPPRAWAEHLGLRAQREIATCIGGETPIRLLNHVARRIAAGEIGVALIGGTNNLRTQRRAAKAGLKLDWSVATQGEPERLGVTQMGHSPGEAAHGLALPITIYPIFENALRARRGLDIATHRQRMGELMSRFSRVAAANPQAWFPIERSAEELTRESAENRMVSFPYTKYLNSVLETNQSASLIVSSVAAARAAGIPERNWVYWWGGAHAQESEWFPSERPDFARCEALERAARGALAEATLDLAAITHFDFYSCFPIAVEMACEMLDIAEDDPRGLTVTGGLPYAGGPGNNYSMHALAAMLPRLRGSAAARALVTGNGWYLTKHSACVLGAAPPAALPAPEPAAAAAAIPEGTRSTAPVRGEGRLETYTIVYDPAGSPVRGIALGRDADGRRFVANTPSDRALFEAWTREEPIGCRGSLDTRDGLNHFTPL